MKNNIIPNHSLLQYNKKYRNCRDKLLKISKKEVEDFDRNNPTLTKGHLLKGHKWWLIDDIYYEIPKPFRYVWFRNLNAACQVGICVFCVGVVAAAVATPIMVYTLNKKSKDIHIEFDEKESFIEIEGLTKQEKSSIEVSLKVETSKGDQEESINTIKIVDDVIKDKYVVEDILSVKIGNKILENNEYVVSKTNDVINVIIKAKVISENKGNVVITPKIIKKENQITPSVAGNLFYNALINTITNLNTFELESNINNFDLKFNRKKENTLFEELYDIDASFSVSAKSDFYKLLEVEKDSQSKYYNSNFKVKSEINDIVLNGKYNFNKTFVKPSNKSDKILHFNTLREDGKNYPVKIDTLTRYVNKKETYGHYYDFSKGKPSEGIKTLGDNINEELGYGPRFKTVISLIASYIEEGNTKTSFHESNGLFDEGVNGLSSSIYDLGHNQLIENKEKIKEFISDFMSKSIAVDQNKFKVIKLDNNIYSFNINLDYLDLNSILSKSKAPYIQFASGECNLNLTTDKNNRIGYISFTGKDFKSNDIKYTYHETIDGTSYLNNITSNIGNCDFDIDFTIDYDGVVKNFDKEIDIITFTGSWKNFEFSII